MGTQELHTFSFHLNNLILGTFYSNRGKINFAKKLSPSDFKYYNHLKSHKTSEKIKEPVL